MRIIRAAATNFQSYEEVAFEYDSEGLVLISGPTGAGKSTLLDLVPWVLFGITGKEGAADDVRSWDASGPTEGVLLLATPNGVIEVRRSRKPNDLYFGEWKDGAAEYAPTRGKDLTDTQRLLEKRLGVTPDLFLTGAYLTQFSAAGSFFIAKAKDRREVLEKIADQEFAINLGEKAAAQKKLKNQELTANNNLLLKAQGTAEALQAEAQSLALYSSKWEHEHAKDIAASEHAHSQFSLANKGEVTVLESMLETKVKRHKPPEYFEAELERLRSEYKLTSELENRLMQVTAEEMAAKKACGPCPTCKRPLSENSNNALLEALKKEAEEIADRLIGIPHCADINAEIKSLELAQRKNDMLSVEIKNLEQQIAEKRVAVSPHAAALEQLRAQVNPFEAKKAGNAKQLAAIGTKVKELTAEAQHLEQEHSVMSYLYDASFELRSLLMTQAVSQIEAATNRLLEQYFDAAIRVQFILADSDKLEVSIFNDGHEASFRQLSGGERCMLKLCFSLALMKAAQNKAGVHFSLIMLDEPLNGLDGGLKVKAFRLLQELQKEYPTVLVIEHSEELKQQFSKVFLVDKIGGHSVINEKS